MFMIKILSSEICRKVGSLDRKKAHKWLNMCSAPLVFRRITVFRENEKRELIFQYNDRYN